jgi:hypothetical protein
MLVEALIGSLEPDVEHQIWKERQSTSSKTPLSKKFEFCTLY